MNSRPAAPPHRQARGRALERPRVRRERGAVDAVGVQDGRHRLAGAYVGRGAWRHQAAAVPRGQSQIGIHRPGGGGQLIEQRFAAHADSQRELVHRISPRPRGPPDPPAVNTVRRDALRESHSPDSADGLPLQLRTLRLRTLVYRKRSPNGRWLHQDAIAGRNIFCELENRPNCVSAHLWALDAFACDATEAAMEVMQVASANAQRSCKTKDTSPKRSPATTSFSCTWPTIDSGARAAKARNG